MSQEMFCFQCEQIYWIRNYGKTDGKESFKGRTRSMC